jgi:predicted ArsR family transcriptional regulator
MTSAPGRPDERPAPSPAEALAQPSRRRIAEILASAPAGLTPFRLAEAVGLHHNAVRRHLEVLARAGVVVSEREAAAGRPGRPSRRYRLVAGEGLAEAGHRELVRLLVELIRRTGAGEHDVEEFGRDEGRLLGHGQRTGAGLAEMLASLGFAPDDVTENAARGGGELDLRLRRCPFADAVLAEGGHLVCALHRGLTLGVLDATEPDAYLAGFEIRDPIAAGCRVHVRGLPPGSAVTGG